MSQELKPYIDLTTIGQIANTYAAQNVFSDYREGKAPRTLDRQKNDLALFSAYLNEAGVAIKAADLWCDPKTWEGMTQGLVKGFVRWLLQKGYAIGSINVRLSTVKRYCSLAADARVIPQPEYGLITLVRGYTHKEGRNINQTRVTQRKGAKKADPVPVSKEQATLLKSQPDTPQGRRDALLMCLLLDHGLRCGEIAGLKPESINLTENTLMFYREKVDKIQAHHLTKDTQIAANHYLGQDQPTSKLLAGSRKGGKLEGNMSTRAITMRVLTLGKTVGLAGLSAHDCRHYWVKAALKGKTDIKALQQAGGWSSPAMPLRYAEDSAIANENVTLG